MGFFFQRTQISLVQEIDRGSLSHFVLSAAFNELSPTHFIACYRLVLKTSYFLLAKDAVFFFSSGISFFSAL